MEYITIISKRLTIISIVLLSFEGSLPSNIGFERSIVGQWKCVMLDYRGYQDFVLTKAEKIKHSILVIENNRIYYERIGFIDTCYYKHWRISVYDTTFPHGGAVDLTYTNSQLFKFINLNP